MFARNGAKYSSRLMGLGAEHAGRRGKFNPRGAARRAVTVGFVNHGYWKNRVDALLRGRKVRNEVYTTEWFESRPANPVTIADFEHFCSAKGITVARRAHLLGDWRTPCRVLPNFFAGYALYDLAR